MKRSVRKALIAVLLVGVFCLSFFVGVYGWKVLSSKGVLPSEIAPWSSTGALSDISGVEGEQVWLIAGLDTVGPMNGGGSIGHNDTLMLAFVRSGTVNLLYIPRDSLVKIPGHGITKVGHTFLYGGVPTLLETIKENFGVTVDHYIVLNFTTVQKFVDLIGGLEVEVPQKYCYIGIGVPRYTCIQPGKQVLNGTEFLVYWRIRNFGRVHISDLERIQRQMGIITGTNLKDQVLAKLSPSFLVKAVNVWSDYVLSDMSLLQVVTSVNKWRHKPIEADMLPGTAASGWYAFDLRQSVSVYIWDSQWLRNWYIAKLGEAGAKLAEQVNPPKLINYAPPSTSKQSDTETTVNSPSTPSAIGTASVPGEAQVSVDIP